MTFIKQNNKPNQTKNIDHVAAFHTVRSVYKSQSSSLAALANTFHLIFAVCANLYCLISNYNLFHYSLLYSMLIYHNFLKKFQK